MYPDVLRAEPLDDFRVLVEFCDGRRGLLDVKPYLVVRGLRRVQRVAWSGGLG